jgi:hypothetical protein
VIPANLIVAKIAKTAKAALLSASAANNPEGSVKLDGFAFA